MHDTNRESIRNAYDSSGTVNEGLLTAQQFILTSSEFNSTNLVKQTSETCKDGNSFPDPTGKPYKAIVMVMFAGGCDSFNLLTPHTCSKGKDLYEEYVAVRQQVALTRDRLLPISASGQICERFGIHEALPVVEYIQQ